MLQANRIQVMSVRERASVLASQVNNLIQEELAALKREPENVNVQGTLAALKKALEQITSAGTWLEGIDQFPNEQEPPFNE